LQFVHIGLFVVLEVQPILRSKIGEVFNEGAGIRRNFDAAARIHRVMEGAVGANAKVGFELFGEDHGTAGGAFAPQTSGHVLLAFAAEAECHGGLF